MLCSKFSLVTYFIHSVNTLFILIPTSQFIPCLHFSLGIYMFPASESLFVLSKEDHMYQFIQILHICVIIQYLHLSFWCTSLCLTVSRSIHVSINDSVLFLSIAVSFLALTLLLYKDTIFINWIWHGFEQTGRWWGAGRPGALQFMGSQGVVHDWVTEQQRCTRIDVCEIEKNKYDSYWIFFFYFKLCILLLLVQVNH